MLRWLYLSLGLIACSSFLGESSLQADERILVEKLLHLRAEGPPEWSTFPAQADSPALEYAFSSEAANPHEYTIRLRQQDVKQSWSLTWNGELLGRLERDENDLVSYFALPAGKLKAGENRLNIVQDKGEVDDIRVGEIALLPQSRSDVLSAGRLRVEATSDAGEPIPCRLTVLAVNGALQTTGAVSSEKLAVRTGVVYTATGVAEIPLPAGRYLVFASRGFEYSAPSGAVVLAEGEMASLPLRLSRQVDTTGYVACDTHVHSFTHSRHGDATVEERMLTLAGEGIELPIATDHNVQIDHEPFAQKMQVRDFFTPVIGNEVTTDRGHFNVFPIKAGAAPPRHQLGDWKLVLDDIFRTPGARVAILNHARDLHRGVRPFSPSLFNPAIGENTAGWAMRFNGMEVINSAAVQTEPLQLLHDWMAILNRGYHVTPVGSSDSHDVSRFIVGQGRTYIRCDDSDPGAIPVDAAVNSFLRGEVLVSYGLLVEMTVDGKYRSGEVAPVPDDEVRVALRVQGPHWAKASHIQLFANGLLLREEAITPSHGLPTGVLWEGDWKIPRPAHDVHLVAIATGPPVTDPFWPLAKPYQPLSSELQLVSLACSGAVWLDADGDGRQSSARDNALLCLARSDGDLTRLVEQLAPYDAAVAAQAADAWHTGQGSLLQKDAQAIWTKSAPAVASGFRRYLDAWKAGEQARARE
ncbi:CehA/McbA family metallohydrolase [Lignipirellula cremea]|uniref:PHP domain protein n=1 Tax=Lignipirellula cremea TaxID=2528010 RepID=A0A518DV79_9BACT|nr:CehA/McbA family metallohydrolase [Lignipirellula cremea]QDU95738.1 hypothetical protein Pla8534_35550 [Lignipirellula cremea]